MTSDNLKKGNVKMDLSSDDKKKVELTLDNGNLNCSKTNLGTYTCTDVAPVKSITGLCVDDSSYAGNNGTVDVNPVSFADDDWATIAAVAKSGKYTEYYNVGDTKEVDLGSLGKHTVRIANTSTPAECNQEGFSESACGFVVEFTDIITTHNMNPSGDHNGKTYQDGWNKDGWPSSAMYKFLNDESDSSSIINLLPKELKNVIKPTITVSGRGSEDTVEYFTSTDKLYLLAPKEIYSDWSNQYDTAKNKTRQLDYYKIKGVTTNSVDGAIKKDSAGSRSSWWLRSAASGKSSDFYAVYFFGLWNNNFANIREGVSPAFRIG